MSGWVGERGGVGGVGRKGRGCRMLVIGVMGGGVLGCAGFKVVCIKIVMIVCGYSSETQSMCLCCMSFQRARNSLAAFFISTISWEDQNSPCS